MLGRNQWGCMPNFSADIVALVEKFIMKTHLLTYRNLFKLQNDANVYFDRIIKSHAILNSRKFEVPDNIYQLYSTALRNTKYRVQAALGTVQYHYQYTPINPFMALGKVQDYLVHTWHSLVYR